MARQSGIQDAAGVDGVRPDAPVRQPAGQLDREEDVGRLALPVGRPGLVRPAVGEVVVVEPERADLVAAARGVDDARPGPGGEDLGHEGVGQQEVPEVVRGQLQLVALLVPAVLRHRHDAGIVDDDVDLGDVLVVEDRGAGLPDRVKVRELALHKDGLDLGVDLGDLLDHGVDLGLGPADENDVFGAPLSECDSYRSTEAIDAGSGDEKGATFDSGGESLDDLGAFSPESERRHDGNGELMIADVCRSRNVDESMSDSN